MTMERSDKIYTYPPRKILSLYNSNITTQALRDAESKGLIPPALRNESNNHRIWTHNELPVIGERYGFLRQIPETIVIAIYSMKGGTYKTTFAVNIGRIAALHNIETVIVGLDMQGDASFDLGMGSEIDPRKDTLEEALEKLEGFYGLYDYTRGDIPLEDLLTETDIPTLSYLPETPDLSQLERDINSMDYREYWLKSHVIDPIVEIRKPKLIIVDCAPSYNNFTTNALMAADIVLSPIECKIKQQRNFPNFYKQVDSFLKGTKRSKESHFRHIFATTKLSNTTLSKSIQKWYLKNTERCLTTSVRDSGKVEDASDAFLSVIEYEPNHDVSREMREMISELWSEVTEVSRLKSEKRKLLAGGGHPESESIPCQN